MSKTRSNRKSSIAPLNAVKKVSTVAKNVAAGTVPVVENGVSAVYGTMATGFDLGVKGVGNLAKGIKSVTRKTHSRSHKKHTKRYGNKKHTKSQKRHKSRKN